MMLDHDEIAIAIILMFSGIDDTACDCKHRGTRRGAVIHAFVGSPGFQDRVQASSCKTQIDLR